jgi:hypothetical protein
MKKLALFVALSLLGCAGTANPTFSQTHDKNGYPKIEKPKFPANNTCKMISGTRTDTVAVAIMRGCFNTNHLFVAVVIMNSKKPIKAAIEARSIITKALGKNVKLTLLWRNILILDDKVTKVPILMFIVN